MNAGFKIQNKELAVFILLAVLVSITVCFVHFPSLSAQVTSFDDYQYILNNRLVRNPSFESVKRFFCEVLNPTTVDGYYQPLTMVSLMLDYALNGGLERHTVFHITSLALHILNTILIMVILYLLFNKHWISAVAGLVFGVHPMTVEPIPWISERKTLLATFFALFAIVLYLRYIKSNKKLFYIFSLSSFILGLLAKPTIVPLPLLLIIIDFWPLKRLNARSLMDKIPFILIAAASAFITYLSQSISATALLPDMKKIWMMIIIIFHDFAFYLQKMLLPLQLTSHYPMPLPVSLSNPVILYEVTATLLLLVLAIASLKWTRAFIASIAFFIAAILPTTGIIGFTNVLTSDKYAYFPLLGFLMLLAWLMRLVANKISGFKRIYLKRILMAGALVVLLAFVSFESVLTRNYLVHWQTTESLVKHMLELDPEDIQLMSMLGNSLLDNGKKEEALAQFKKAEVVNGGAPGPYMAEVYNNIGIILGNKRKYEEALDYYAKAIKADTKYYLAYSNAAKVLFEQNKVDDALKSLQMAVTINPDYASAYCNMGIIYASQKDIGNAIKCFSKAITLDPGLTQPKMLLARAYIAIGEYDKGLVLYRELIALMPGNTEIKREYEYILTRLGQK